MGRDNQIFYKKDGLDESFSKIFDFPLTVVTAPMGYGKSTAVKKFLSQTKAQILEILISEKRDSAACFWEMLFEAFQAVDEQLGDRLGKLGFPKNTQQVWELTAEIESVHFDSPVVIAADDFHLLHSQQVNLFIQAITYQNIENLHIVLIGRKQPDMELLEMQMKQLCYPIGQAELMFSPNDVREYFRMHGCLLTEEEAYTVYQNTEGWVSAIYLILLEYKETKTIEDTRPVSIIIENVIFGKYDERMQSFLIKLSVMNEFSFQEALYLTEEPDTREYLKDLEETNAFVTYDSISGVYRIHKLMGQFLYNKLLRRSDINKKLLCERAGDWYLKHDQLFSAFEYYIEAKQYEKVLNYLSQAGAVNIIEKHSELLERIFGRISEDTALSYPMAYLVYVYKFLFARDKRKAEQALKRIEQKCRENQAEESILGEIYLAKSLLHINNPPDFLKWIAQAKVYLPKGSRILSADSIINLVAPPISFIYYRKQGGYQEYTQLCIAGMQEYEQLTKGGGAGMKYLLQAEYYLETGQLEKASLEAQKAIYKAEFKKQKSIIICAAFCLARIYLCQNRPEEGLNLLAGLQKEMAVQRDFLRLQTTEAAQGYLCSCLNILEDIPNGIRQRNAAFNLLSHQNNFLEAVICCWMLAAEKDFIKLEMRCEEMLEYYVKNNIIMGIIYTYIYQAVAKLNLYGHEEGRESLEEALRAAEKDEIIMPFAEAGMFILPMLYEIQEESKFQKDYISRIITIITNHSACHKVSSPANLKTIKELTKREEEVLRLMAQGMTNKEIGSTLFIANITVGKTCSSIFKKLHVKGRVGAIQYLNNLDT